MREKREIIERNKCHAKLEENIEKEKQLSEKILRRDKVGEDAAKKWCKSSEGVSAPDSGEEQMAEDGRGFHS